MKLVIASKNPQKVDAVKQACTELGLSLEIECRSVPSGVSHQPFGLDLIVMGARSRARNAFENCDLSIGVESGIFEAPNRVYFDVGHVVVYDGGSFYEGGTPYFEVPRWAVERIKAEGLEMSYFWDGKTDNGIGAIGVLTSSAMIRKEQIAIGAKLALARYLNRGKYTEGSSHE